MAESLHVNGEAHIKVVLAGSTVSLLGVTIDGADAEVRDITVPVYVDTTGGPEGPPFDEQQMLSDATIRAQLVYYDDAVLAAVRGRPNADGLQGQAGAFWGQGSGYFKLIVTALTAGELGFTFPTARVRDAARGKLGTRRTVWDVTFYGIGYANAAGSTVGRVLYTRP